MPYHLAFKSKVISKLVKEIVKWMKLTNSAFLVFAYMNPSFASTFSNAGKSHFGKPLKSQKEQKFPFRV